MALLKWMLAINLSTLPQDFDDFWFGLADFADWHRDDRQNRCNFGEGVADRPIEQ